MTATRTASDTGALTAVTADACEALARGAAILGTGGGGDPYIGRLLAEAAIRQHGPVPIVPLHEVPADATVVAVAMMGAPTVMVEKVPSGAQFAQAVRSLTAHLGIIPTHVTCIEVGGVNSTSPLVAAAELGLPVVDGDGMGRAFPELQMVLPTLYGHRATPMALADEKGNTLILDTIDNRWAERFARTATVEMGCTAITAQYVLTGAQLAEAYVPGTLSLCVRLGGAVATARAANDDPVAAVAELLGGRVLAGGKVTDVERRTSAGFARGTARIAGTGPDAGSEVVLQFQNEHVLVSVDGVVRTTAPDLIVVLDAETAEPVTTEGLRYGARVRIVTAPADARWHSPAALELVGPRYFGYDTDPVRFDGTAQVRR